MHSLYKKMIVTVHGVFVENKYNNNESLLGNLILLHSGGIFTTTM